MVPLSLWVDEMQLCGQAEEAVVAREPRVALWDHEKKGQPVEWGALVRNV